MNELHTDRLTLRQWRESDRADFAVMNADPEVMKHFLAPLSQAESDELFDRAHRHIEQHDWGVWAVEERESQQWLGFVGLWAPSVALPCSPCIEIAWRLRRQAWGYGFASEAASEALRHGFEVLQLDEVVSFTTTTNLASERLMQRIGMLNSGENFDHPSIPPEHPLAEHVLYRLSSSNWRAFSSQR